MLAGDAPEAIEQAEEFLKERHLSDYYDGIVLRGLQLAQTDLAAGSLELERTETIRLTILELVNDLVDSDESPPIIGENILRPKQRPRWRLLFLDRISGFCRLSTPATCMNVGHRTVRFFALPVVALWMPQPLLSSPTS